MEDAKWFLFYIACFVIFIFAMNLIDKWLTSSKIRKRLKAGTLIKTSSKIVGALQAIEEVRSSNPYTRAGNQPIKEMMNEKYLILEFMLKDGTVVREKSKHAMKRNTEVGKTVQIAYNPKDLKEIYLLD
ncbi:MAG: hypothetical protein ACI85I_002472 [Arenicella sp.]|jgi:hypothetical protein